MGLANDVSSFAATVVRLGRGISSPIGAARGREPQRLLELYDFEGCPYCRKVREVLSELDLDYLAHPVAHGSPRRKELLQLGGKVQAPYLIDPNTGTRLYESDDIIEYLKETYGEGHRAGWRVPIPSVLDNLVSGVATVARLGRGTRCRSATVRDLEPLALYNMEGSPYCRKVRETLCELDLEYIVHNVPKGSPKRAALLQRGGKVQVPYLVDPNEHREMYESDDIIAYLERQYHPGKRASTPRTRSQSARAPHAPQSN